MGRTRCSLVALFTVLAFNRVAHAAEPALSYTASTTYQHLFTAEMEHGGSVASERLGVSAGMRWRPAPAFSAGVSLNYEVQDWAFEPGGAFGASPPWGTLERGSVSVPVGLALSPHFVTGASPFAEWSYERDAGASDALTYGASLSAFGIFSNRFTLGGGAKIHRQYFATKVTAFVVVNWQLNERLRIANSQAAGPLGAGGVELRYTLAPKWEMSIGGVQRSDRIRMAPEGTTSGDVAEQSAIPFYGRVSYGVGTGLRADLYAGVLQAGRIRRWDPDGVQLVDEDIASEPALALVLSGRW